MLKSSHQSLKSVKEMFLKNDSTVELGAQLSAPHLMNRTQAFGSKTQKTLWHQPYHNSKYRMPESHIARKNQQSLFNDKIKQNKRKFLKMK
jgi:hypothetical protein